MPAPASMGALAPAGLNVPAASGVGALASAELYVPAGSSVAALAPAPPYVPAGSTSSAAEEVAPAPGICVPDPPAWRAGARAAVRAGRIDQLRCRGGRAGAGNKCAGIRQHGRAGARRTERPGRVLGRGAGARGAIGSRRIGRRRARARAAVSAGRVDQLSRRGGRPGEWNIRAGIRQRGRAGARAAVGAGRVDCRRARSRWRGGGR